MPAHGGCSLAMVVTFSGLQLAYFLPRRKGSGLGSLPLRRCCDVTLPPEPKGRTELRASPGGEDMVGQRQCGREGWARVPAIATLCPQGP